MPKNAVNKPVREAYVPHDKPNAVLKRELEDAKVLVTKYERELEKASKKVEGLEGKLYPEKKESKSDKSKYQDKYVSDVKE